MIKTVRYISCGFYERKTQFNVSKDASRDMVSAQMSDIKEQSTLRYVFIFPIILYTRASKNIFNVSIIRI